MTPKEKANELYNKFYNTDFHGNSIKIRDLLTKECALKAVDEIIHSKPTRPFEYDAFNIPMPQIDWWKAVKQEIEKL